MAELLVKGSVQVLPHDDGESGGCRGKGGPPVGTDALWCGDEFGVVGVAQGGRFGVGGFGECSEPGGEATQALERGLEPVTGGGVALDGASRWRRALSSSWSASSGVLRVGKRISVPTPPARITTRTMARRRTSDTGARSASC